jgi:hypothetical protein
LTPSPFQTSPSNSSSFPPIIRKKEDLPEPFRPRTPILAPRVKATDTSRNKTRPPGKTFVKAFAFKTISDEPEPELEELLLLAEEVGEEEEVGDDEERFD